MSYFRIDLFMLIVALIYLTAQAKAEEQNQDECGGQIIRAALQSLDPADPVGGTTNLCVSRAGVQVRTSVVGLKQGNAYTVWFVYIEQPALCEHPGICDSASDYVANDPVGVLGRMDSPVVARSGHLRFSGNIPGMRLSWVPGANYSNRSWACEHEYPESRPTVADTTRSRTRFGTRCTDRRPCRSWERDFGIHCSTSALLRQCRYRGIDL